MTKSRLMKWVLFIEIVLFVLMIWLAL